MRRTIAEVAASVSAGAVTYATFEYAKPFNLTVRILIALGVTVAAIIVAGVLRRRDRGAGYGTSVGDDLKADDISLEDVDVTNPSGDVRVGTRWRSGSKARISGVKVHRKDDIK